MSRGWLSKLLLSPNSVAIYPNYVGNDFQINNFEIKVLASEFKLRRNFARPFIISDVQIAITTADLIKHIVLLGDLANQRLFDRKADKIIKIVLIISTVQPEPIVRMIFVNSSRSRNYWQTFQRYIHPLLTVGTTSQSTPKLFKTSDVF